MGRFYFAFQKFKILKTKNLYKNFSFNIINSNEKENQRVVIT